MMSLRLRLVVFPVIVVVAGLIALAFYQAHDARERVRAETRSGVEIGRLLVKRAVNHASQATTVEAALADLAGNLPPAVRHVRLEIEPGGPVTRAPPLYEARAPEWFEHIVASPPAVERYPLVIGGEAVATVVLTADPDDEIAEVWADWKTDMALIGALSAAIILVVIAAVGISLRPLTALTQAVDRLEGGDFAVRVKPSADPQLRKLGERFNRLVESLEQATADNRLLINELMSVQEAERKEIARELHDEYGPSLFAIRADVGAISRWVRKREPRFEEIRERLASISSLVTQIQRINSRLLEHLRPLAVGQMRLHEALQGLVSDWRSRYPDLSWEADFEPVGELGDAAEHALYRAAQECMTNVVRHADASRVTAKLSRHNGSAVLVVEDDGKGVPPGRAFGFGLLGMAERARAAGGRMALSRGEAGGARVEVVVPAGRAA